MESPLLNSAREILARLVATATPSARTNRPIIDYAGELLRHRGWHVTLLPYRDAAKVEKCNLIACTAPGDAPVRAELALVGHTDTVPADAAWRQAYVLTERDGRLHGRGACDNKGFVAAALAAALAVEPRSLARPLALVLTADEEIGCLGAKKLAEANALQARYAIVGEPTSLRPVRAGKGYGLAEVIVRGREAHSAYPALGVSAITQAAKLITRLGEVTAALQAQADPAFDPPHTTLNIGQINGGSAKNIIAGECRFQLEWRPVPNGPPRGVLELVKALAETLRREDETFLADVDLQRIDPGFATPRESRLVEFLETWSRRPAGTVAFATEAPQLVQLGAETVVFGPGNMSVAHRTDEYVTAADLEQCAEALLAVIGEFCR